MSVSNATESGETNQTLNNHTPTLAYCPVCSKNVITEVRISYSMMAHITCVFCLVVGCWFGCCFLPYFSMCYVTAKHYCPECGSHLASYTPLLEYLH